MVTQADIITFDLFDKNLCNPDNARLDLRGLESAKLNLPAVEFPDVYVIIPMLNEERSIASVLRDLPRVAQTIVVDNGSTDRGPELARNLGAQVVRESTRGYGRACLSGMAFIEELEPELEQKAIIVFLDADYSDHPEELVDLAAPIRTGEYDFVVGSRSIGKREAGAMPLQAILGNWLACSLMWLFWGAKHTDLGPFRAIRWSSLKQLEMQDQNFGWTIEMQIKARQQSLRTLEVPVSYRRRIGTSKISGTLSGTFKAGYKILYTIFKYRFFPGG